MIKVISHTQNQMTLEISFTEISPQTLPNANFLAQTGLQIIHEAGQPPLPAIVWYMPPDCDASNVRILAQEPGIVINKPLSSFFTNSLDSAYTLQEETPADSSRFRMGVFPEVPVQLKTLGQFRGMSVQALYFYPFQQFNKNQVQSWKSLTVELSCQKNRANADNSILQSPANAIVAMIEQKMPRKLPDKSLMLGKSANEALNLAQVKITVNQEGIYQIRYEDLIEADIDLPEHLDPWEFRLTNKGQDVPFYIMDRDDRSFDPGDYIEFFGDINKAPQNPATPDVYLDPYSSENVYWLEWGHGQGQRMIEEEGLVLETDPARYRAVYSFPAKVHMERDIFFDRLGRYQSQIPRDHWFMDRGVFSSEKQEYALNLPDPDSQSDQPVQVKIMLHGQTYSKILPHTVEAFFNEHLVLNGSWSGQNLFQLETTPDRPINANVLRERGNSITIVNRVPAGEVDNVFVNWIEVVYPRLMKAHQGFLEFTTPADDPPGLFDFTVKGFSTDQISIYKIGVSKIIGADVESVEKPTGEISYQIHFQDEVLTPNARYLAVEENAKLRPLKLEAHKPLDLRDPSIAADYVVIAYDSLLHGEALQTLISHRQQQGLKVTAVPVSEIFNQFSYGLFTPEGIKNFLRYAYNNWSLPLQYVLLVGDGSYDNRDLHKQGANLIPVFMRQVAKYGAAPSDHWYSLLTPGDELPDVYVGRLPVNNEKELAILVDKIIEYETIPQKDIWLNRMLLIGGNGKVFRQQSEHLARNVLPARMEVHRLYTYQDQPLADDPFFGGTSDLIDYINDGVFLLNFMGHGGGAIWADNSLMRLEDVDRLTNKGRYPIITSMTCFTGAFEVPNRQALAERLLLAPDAGSPAIWASSGLGWVREDFNIVQELFGLLAKFGNELTLGQYLAAAKLNYIGKHLDAVGFSILNQYNLLGDPAMRLMLPDRKINLTLSRSLPQKGDTLTVAGSTEFLQGSGSIQIVNEQLQTELSIPINIQNAKFSQSITIPQSLKGEEGWIRVYVRSEDGQQHSSSAKKVGFNSIIVDSIFTNIQQPGRPDSIRFFAKLEHTNPLVQNAIFVSLPEPDTLKMIYNETNSLYVSERTYRPLAPGEFLRFHLSVKDNQDHAWTSETIEIKSPRGPDLVLLPNYFKFVGDQQIAFQASAFNLGDADADNVVIQFEKLNPQNQSWALIGRDTLTIPQKDHRIARIHFFPGTGKITIRTTIDPENLISEPNEGNNIVEQSYSINLFPVTPEFGTTLQQSQGDTAVFDRHLEFFVAPGIVDRNIVMTVLRQSDIPKVHQPDFVPVIEHALPVAYRFTLADSNSARVIPQIRLFFKTDSIRIKNKDGTSVSFLDLPNSSVCRFDQASQKWLKVAAQKKQNGFEIMGTAPGLYGLFLVNDQTPPKVELTVEGQLFSEGGFVPTQPTIGVTALDMNGIDQSSEGIKIWVDESPLPYQQLVFSDSASAYNSTAITFRPTFSSGPHSVRVQITDAAGNASEPLESHFKVSEAQKLIFLGNYPNPFKNRTTFAYELTDHARDLQLKIYATSGHLIRTINADEIVEDPNPLGPNYHEITWDVRDQFGERVANGLYYFKLKVNFQDHASEFVGRIARLK